MSWKNGWTALAVAVMALGLIAAPASAATITAYYDFEGTGDDRFDDPAGEFADNLVGQFNPAFSNDTAGAFAGTQSASFNGNSALFTDAHTTDLGPDPNAYTIMFWVKGSDANQENNNTRLMTTRVLPNGSGNPVNTWQVEGFGNNGNNGDRMDVRMNQPGPGNWFSPDATNALANNGEQEDWHHVAFILSNSGHPNGSGDAFSQTFVDGVQTGLESESPWNGLNIGNDLGQLIIGGNSENAGTRAFTGLLDDVALFSGIVSAEDIAAIAAGRLSPRDFIAFPVPEPTTAALAMMGLGGLVMRRRRASA